MGQFSHEDLGQLAAIGIEAAEVSRQLELFANPPAYRPLVRPCAVGDGIRRLSEREIEEYAKSFGESGRTCKIVKFVPASGAASRMFKSLLAFRATLNTDPAASPSNEVREFLGGLDRFAFFDDLRARMPAGVRLSAQDQLRATLDALLTPEGLDYPSLPKGLLKFHRYGSSSRTPFEEHLVEAALYARSADDLCRLHFTVSNHHRSLFESLLAEVRHTRESVHSVRFVVDFSEQLPSTDTIAVDLENGPFRDADGRLVFRPGGHGALIENLAGIDADVVFVKNIDNVVPDHLKEPTVLWKQVLGGILLEAQRKSFDYLGRLEAEELSVALLDEVKRFVANDLCVAPSSAQRNDGERLRDYLIDRLSRPLRVCGMVRNEGEPGGGPFWVRSADGAQSIQIVESAEVDPNVVEQQGILKASTHFNPVDLVCATRDRNGARLDLRRYVDRSAVFVSEKSLGGRVLKALEHPGLWNGAMAQWNTIFVEVPLSTFNPVKTVNDLLRREHQPAA